MELISFPLILSAHSLNRPLPMASAQRKGKGEKKINKVELHRSGLTSVHLYSRLLETNNGDRIESEKERQMGPSCD